MRTSDYGTIQALPYWNGWTLSACIHTVVVGSILFLTHQLPTPQIAERNPIAVAFVTPQPTHTPPTHHQTMKKSPPTPTVKPKQVQPEVIPREPTRAKPRMHTQIRQTVSPQTVVKAAPKPAPLPKLQVTNATPISMPQPKAVRHTQTASQPAVKNGTISSQPMARAVGKSAPQRVSQPVTQTASQPAVKNGRVSSQPVPQHTGTARQHVSPKVHASPSRKKPIHVEATIDKVDPVMPREIIHNHVASAPQRIATPVRSAPLQQSVNTLPAHVEKRIHAPTTEVMKQRVTNGKSHTAARHVFPKRARQQTSRSSGSHVVQTRTTVNYTRQMRKARPATTSRSASTGGLSPELLAFSKLLREKVARTLEFPRLAKRLGYSGTTHVAIALSKTGIVRDLKVSQPSGYEILDKAAIVTLQEVLQTTKPPESIEIEQLVIPIAFNLKRH